MDKQYIFAGIILEENDRVAMLKCTRAGTPDTYYAPHSLVKTGERLRDVAKRNIFQHCGLVVEARQLLYVEEIIAPVEGFRFWFRGEWMAGETLTEALEEVKGFKTEVRWLAQEDILSRNVSPMMMLTDYWSLRDAGFESPRYIIV